MFFNAAKLGWALLSPLNLIFLLLVGGSVLLFLTKKAGRRLIVLTVLLLAAFGIFPAGHNMMVWLESGYERPPLRDMPAKVDGILVLGGIFETQVSAARQTTAINGHAERVLDALLLAKKYPNAIVLFSGGNGQWLADAPEETADAAKFFKDMGFPNDQIVFEDRSRNTYENVVFTKDLIQPQKSERWILVTSSYHMPRTVGVFRQVKWPGRLVFWPTDYQTDGRYGWIPGRFDILGNLYDFSVALHEIIGIVVYRLTGKFSMEKLSDAAA